MNKTQKLLLAAGVALAAREIWAKSREANLRGQVVLVTGGSRGLGLAIAREFADKGCRLALCARDEEELIRAEEDLNRRSAEVLTVVCDLRKQVQVEDLVRQVTDHYGRIDILVNSAGIIEVGPVENQAIADFEDAMQTDFWGILYPIMAVLPQMRKRRSGRIVNITSIGGKVSVPHLLPYACAKFAATGLSEGLRAELVRDGIVVTTIVPGLLRTGSFLNALFKGNHAGEYAWFSVGDSLPGLSMSTEQAARQIVRATRRGEAERILGMPANLAARFQGLFPGATADLSALVNRVLPPPDSTGGDQTKPGSQVQKEQASPERDALIGLGLSAAERLNEH